MRRGSIEVRAPGCDGALPGRGRGQGHIIGPTEPDSHVGYRGLWSRHYDEASLGSSETGRELEALLANCADFGTSGELLHADELATRFPDLRIPAGQVGV